MYPELGAIMHVAQPEYDAGKGGGEDCRSWWFQRCRFNHEPFNTALLERCQGFADGIGESLNMVEVSQDFDDIKNTVIAYMSSNPNTGAIMAVGPTGCDPTIAALEEMGMNGKIILGCFDLGPQIVDGIVNGTVHYAIDQQQFLQGYLPVVLHLNHYNGTLPGNSINSGPGFVTTGNVEQVKLAGVMTLNQHQPLWGGHHECPATLNGKIMKRNDNASEKSGLCRTLSRVRNSGLFSGWHHCRDLHDDDEYQRHFTAMWGNPIGIQAWVELAAFVGILAIGASLLMIAGEFDLSMGADIALAGHSFALLLIRCPCCSCHHPDIHGAGLCRLYYRYHCCPHRAAELYRDAGVLVRQPRFCRVPEPDSAESVASVGESGAETARRWW